MSRTNVAENADKKALRDNSLADNDLAMTGKGWPRVSFRCDPRVKAKLVKESKGLKREERAGREGELGQLLRRIVKGWLGGVAYMVPRPHAHVILYGEWMRDLHGEDRKKVREYGNLLAAQRDDRIRRKRRR